MEASYVVGRLQIQQNLLDHVLGFAVGIGDADAGWVLFVQRQVLRSPVYGSGTREDESFHAGLFCRLKGGVKQNKSYY